MGFQMMRFFLPQVTSKGHSRTLKYLKKGAR